MGTTIAVGDKTIDLDSVDINTESVRAKLDGVAIGKDLDIDGLKIAYEKFRAEATKDVPYDVVLEFATNLATVLLGNGKVTTPREAFDAGFEAVKNGSIEFLMFVAGGGFASRSAETALTLALLEELGHSAA